MFKKLVSIYKGWSNYAWPSQEIENMAKRRAKHCAKCEHAKKMPFEILVDGRVKSISGMACGICECPLSTKLRSKEEECPIERW